MLVATSLVLIFVSGLVLWFAVQIAAHILHTLWLLLLDLLGIAWRASLVLFIIGMFVRVLAYLAWGV